MNAIRALGGTTDVLAQRCGRADAPSPGPRAAATDDDLRVLVADDDEDAAWLWARLLVWNFGAEVTALFDGTSAAARVAKERFDLIVTDLNMPGASGLVVCRNARIRDPRVPVVIASGWAPDHVVAEATRLGNCEIILKPFDLEEAEALVRSVLSSSRSRAEEPAEIVTVSPPLPSLIAGHRLGAGVRKRTAHAPVTEAEAGARHR